MLIDGVILEQGPMHPPHAITLGLVEEAIRTAFGPGWWLRRYSQLILGQDTDPEPDLAVVPGRVGVGRRLTAPPGNRPRAGRG
jgi:hypothetical protein